MRKGTKVQTTVKLIVLSLLTVFILAGCENGLLDLDKAVDNKPAAVKGNVTIVFGTGGDGRTLR
uniref:Lipoprotein n=1 Tax=uncultured bacterium contig00178 TaxID=1181600 RepID=A0A806KL97_9BACT|nr:hypothetical protein [uncultured bacterium contig00178]